MISEPVTQPKRPRHAESLHKTARQRDNYRKPETPIAMNQSIERNLAATIPFVVLGTLPLGERDTLLRIVEPRAGTLSIVLRNARSHSKGRASWRTLDLFDQASGRLTIRPARMPTLNSFDRLPSFSSLRTDLTKFGAASTLAESTLLLFSEQSETDATLYETVTHFLGTIDDASSPRDTLKALTRALISLLALAGYGLLHEEMETASPTEETTTTLPAGTSATPSPRVLRQTMAAIERVTNKELRTGPTITRILSELPPRK